MMNYLHWFMTSRKALTALVAWIATAVLTVMGLVPVEDFIEATLWLAGILITGVAIEDAAKKLGGGVVKPLGDEVQPR